MSFPKPSARTFGQASGQKFYFGLLVTRFRRNFKMEPKWHELRGFYQASCTYAGQHPEKTPKTYINA